MMSPFSAPCAQASLNASFARPVVSSRLPGCFPQLRPMIHGEPFSGPAPAVMTSLKRPNGVFARPHLRSTSTDAGAAINEMKSKDLVKRAVEMGEHLGAKLNALGDKHPSIGDVRGLGLFWAVELVCNRTTKAPFNTPADKVEGMPLTGDAVAAHVMASGVYLQSWISHFVIATPFIIAREEIDHAVSVFDEALQNCGGGAWPINA